MYDLAIYFQIVGAVIVTGTIYFGINFIRDCNDADRRHREEAEHTKLLVEQSEEAINEIFSKLK